MDVKTHIDNSPVTDRIRNRIWPDSEIMKCAFNGYFSILWGNMMNVTCPDNIYITHMHTIRNIFFDSLDVFI